jgi:predicted O-methyltransferase YrrM
MLFRAFRYSKRVVQKPWLARKLARASGYSFTSDYVSRHLTSWKGLLEEYRARPDVRMLEIGSYEGRSAVWFLENILTHPTARIVCVDLFTRLPFELRFDHNIRISGSGDKVTKMKGRSETVLSSLPLDHFDIIYVDGSHRATGVLMDAMLSWYALKDGGVMIFDDYLWDLEDAACDRPRMAIDLFLKAFEGSYELLLKDYQVAVRKRPKQTQREP